MCFGPAKRGLKTRHKRPHDASHRIHVSLVCKNPLFLAIRVEPYSWSLVRSSARPIFFPRIDESHRDWIHSSLTAVYYFDSGYVGKQPMALKEYCAEYWLKELQVSMGRCTGLRHITEILLKTGFYTIKSINQSYS